MAHLHEMNNPEDTNRRCWLAIYGVYCRRHRNRWNGLLRDRGDTVVVAELSAAHHSSGDGPALI
jgi:hypothetical protein